jgi:hypothetical protein
MHFAPAVQRQTWRWTGDQRRCAQLCDCKADCRASDLVCLSDPGARHQPRRVLRQAHTGGRRRRPRASLLVRRTLAPTEGAHARRTCLPRLARATRTSSSVGFDATMRRWLHPPKSPWSAAMPSSLRSARRLSPSTRGACSSSSASPGSGRRRCSTGPPRWGTSGRSPSCDGPLGGMLLRNRGPILVRADITCAWRTVRCVGQPCQRRGFVCPGWPERSRRARSRSRLSSRSPPADRGGHGSSSVGRGSLASLRRGTVAQ